MDSQCPSHRQRRRLRRRRPRPRPRCRQGHWGRPRHSGRRTPSWSPGITSSGICRTSTPGCSRRP
eukprot:10570298-Alexandrium_andersonii.AAC.1